VKLYEAMFVVDSAKAKDYDRIEGECHSCITRHGGEIVKSVKFDDRRMCYEIKKVRHGVYILIHFNADPNAIQKIERQIQLSENILRALILVDEDGLEFVPAKERKEDVVEAVSESLGASDPESQELS